MHIISNLSLSLLSLPHIPIEINFRVAKHVYIYCTVQKRKKYRLYSLQHNLVRWGVAGPWQKSVLPDDFPNLLELSCIKIHLQRYCSEDSIHRYYMNFITEVLLGHGRGLYFPDDFQNSMGASLSRYTSLVKISWKSEQ